MQSTAPYTVPESLVFTDSDSGKLNHRQARDCVWRVRDQSGGMCGSELFSKIKIFTLPHSRDLSSTKTLGTFTGLFHGYGWKSNPVKKSPNIAELQNKCEAILLAPKDIWPTACSMEQGRKAGYENLCSWQERSFWPICFHTLFLRKKPHHLNQRFDSRWFFVVVSFWRWERVWVSWICLPFPLSFFFLNNLQAVMK